MSGDHNQYQKATGYAMNERIIKLEIKAKELDRRTTKTKMIKELLKVIKL